MKSRYLEWPFTENFLAYKKVKNKFNSLTGRTKRNYFANIVKAESNQTSKSFWNSVKLFIINKGTVSEGKIAINPETDEIIKIKDKYEISIKVHGLINNKKALVEMFNHNYINIVETTAGLALKTFGSSTLAENDSETLKN